MNSVGQRQDMDNDRVPLPRYIAEKADEAASLSGHQILLEEDPGVELYVGISLSGKKAHVLHYPTTFREHLPHLLLLTAHRILRLWETPASERYLPYTNVENLGSESSEDLWRALAKPGRSPEDLGRYFRVATVNQVTSLPVDIRSEWEIAQTYTHHRGYQTAYLRRQLAEREARYAPNLAEKAPERVHAAGCAMNIVAIDETADILGGRVYSKWHETEYCELADRLRDKFDTITPGHPGDREVIDAWAKKLGMRDWYEWVAVERWAT